MVAGGFVVLTMGEARPLQNVGGLTAAAMMVAALATFAAIPVLARKRAYDARPRIAEILPAATPSSSAAGALGARDALTVPPLPDPRSVMKILARLALALAAARLRRRRPPAPPTPTPPATRSLAAWTRP